MKLKYAVLCSVGNEQRIQNVRKMRLAIPELNVVMANMDDCFRKHIELFNVEEQYDGVVILEDDVQLCKNFKERLATVLAGHEHEVVSMFESACSKKPLKSECRNGGRFAWNQCNYYPKEIGKQLADPKWLDRFLEYFYTKRNEPWNYPIDIYISYVLNELGLKYWMSVPFLVQHLDMQSNFPGRSLNRQSKYFIDDMGD